MADKAKREPDLSLYVNRHEPVKVDDKGRITLHREFVEALGSQVTLVCDVSNVIRMYPADQFNETQMNAKRRFSPDNTAANYYFTVLYSDARRVEIDSSNRMPIPADHRNSMELDAEGCVVIASGREFMILSKAAYKSYKASPLKFMASQREEMELLRKKAFEEEEELRRLERSLSPG